MALESQHPIVEEAVRGLDRLPAQVMVETMIVEVVLNDDLRYGVDWFLRTGGNPDQLNREGIGQTPLSLVTLATGGVASRTLFTPARYLFQFTQDKVNALLSMLEERTQVRVIASPRIFATDNQKARVSSGSRVPFLTAVPGAPGTQSTQNIDTRDVGIILELTPHINEDRTINMAIRQEVSNVTTETFFGAPVVDTREVETTVLVKDGMSVILGGIMKEERRTIDRQIPLLGDLPLVGMLFRSSQSLIQRQELLLILTPRVVTKLEEAKDLYKERDRKMLKELNVAP